MSQIQTPTQFECAVLTKKNTRSTKEHKKITEYANHTHTLA